MLWRPNPEVAPWPWRAHRSRVQIIALVCVSILALGPIAALAMTLSADSSPVTELIPAPPPDPSTTRVTVTTLGISPQVGEVRARVRVQPPADMAGPDGQLVEPLTLTTNDIGGSTSRSFGPGQVLAPFELVLPLTDGSITRYPVDNYAAVLVGAVATDDDSGTHVLPVDLEVTSTVTDFEVEATRRPPDQVATDLLAVDFTAERPVPTTVYAIWLMVLMWGLAVTGLLIIWAVVIWQVESPMWVFGYFVGILFALPPLRESLPGRPPPGTIFDFVSFYWSITIVGASLVLLLVIWIRRARWEARARSALRSKVDEPA